MKFAAKYWVAKLQGNSKLLRAKCVQHLLHHSLICSALLSLFLSACAPEISKSGDESPTTPERYEGTVDTENFSEIPAQWWFAFQDQQLNQIIETTLSENPNLGVAYSHLVAARAAVNATKAMSGPRLDGNFGVAYSESSRTTPLGSLLDSLPGRPQIKGRQINVGAVASWEPDFWNRVSNATKAAKTKVDSSISDIHYYKLVLTSEAITFYWQARAAEADFYLQSSLKRARTNRINLLTAKLNGGLVNEYELTKVKLELARIEIELDEALKRRQLAVHGLATLQAIPISDFSLPWLAEGTKIPKRPIISPGTPASILSRRPDLIQLEQGVRATLAMRNIARSAFYPSIRLTGAYGFASKELDELLKKDSREVSLGPLAISIPLLDRGKNRSNFISADAAYTEAVSAYKSRLLLDLKEVDDSLTEIKNTEGQLKIFEDALEIAKRGEAINRARFEGGLINYFEVTSSMETVIELQRNIVHAKEKLIVDTVLLVRALGGAPDVGNDTRWCGTHKDLCDI